MVQEAGGIITAPDGASDYLRSGNVLCASPRIHREMADTLVQHIQ
jgi:fructose-1,6-bisphosphatase/inositol monophosphatase family enzyme